MYGIENFDHNYRNFVNSLSLEELDALKFQLSVSAVKLLDGFSLPSDPKQRDIFDKTTWQIANIQPYSSRIKDYGLAYLGRPKFMTKELLENLQKEAGEFRSKAKVNYGQWISPVETSDSSTFAEKLETSPQLLKLLNKVAGECVPSYISNYIYYDSLGQNSFPHVDNSFTAVTVMIGLRHNGIRKKSSSIIYWPNAEPMYYTLKPGELAIFFGTTMIHGRTPVIAGEEIHSMLLSFRPKF